MIPSDLTVLDLLVGQITGWYKLSVPIPGLVHNSRHPYVLGLPLPPSSQSRLLRGCATSPSVQPALPDWLGPLVVREVTGESEYLNRKLAC